MSDEKIPQAEAPPPKRDFEHSFLKWGTWIAGEMISSSKNEDRVKDDLEMAVKRIGEDLGSFPETMSGPEVEVMLELVQGYLTAAIRHIERLEKQIEQRPEMAHE